MKKRVSILILLLLFVFSQMVFWAYAEPEADENESTSAPSESIEPTQEPTEASTEKELEVPITGGSIPSPLLDYGVETDFQIRAKAAALIDLKTGALIYSYEIDKQIYPASLTKIMTCMLALEYGHLDDMVTVSYDALQNLSLAGSSAGLLEGEKISLRDLLYCVMISSANEGCNVVAEYVSGDIDTFVALMNQRAQELGMTSTHFANTHGLHDENHYTTVRDMSTLARWAWQYEAFREFACATVHVVPKTNLSEERTLHTTNYLISGLTVGKYYYDKAMGIKTGFTTPAGGCLISAASSGGYEFMSIVCGCETLENEDGTTTDERFTETKRLFEYGFQHCSYVQVLTDTSMVDMPEVLYSDGRANVVVRAKENVSILLPDTCNLSEIELTVSYDTATPLEAPLEAGQRVGTVSATYNGHTLATCDLVTLTAVGRSEPKYVAEKTGSFFSKLWDGVKRVWFLALLLLLVLIFIAVLLIMRAINIRKAKKRAKRNRRNVRRDL